MKIDEGSILVENKIAELEKIVKKAENIEKIKYVFKEIVPQILLWGPAIMGQVEVCKSNLSTEVKSMLTIMIGIYGFIVASTIFLTHDSYVFVSSDKTNLEKLKKIQSYLSQSINLLKDVDINDFENFLNNFNDEFMVKQDIKLDLKKL